MTELSCSNMTESNIEIDDNRMLNGDAPIMRRVNNNGYDGGQEQMGYGKMIAIGLVAIPFFIAVKAADAANYVWNLVPNLSPNAYSNDRAAK